MPFPPANPRILPHAEVELCEKIWTPPRFEAPAALRVWHLASLDAPTVAVVWSLSFARAAGIHLPLWVPLLLALGTWAVYVGDRLLDAARALRGSDLDSLRERHFFHWRHRHTLLPLACLSAVAAAVVIFTQMPLGLRERNSVFGVATLAYFSGVHLPAKPRWLRLTFSKELLVGFLFAAGCVLPTLSRLGSGTSSKSFFAIFCACGVFASLAWLNCFAIDRWESGRSSNIRQPAFRVVVASVVATLVSAAFAPQVSLLIASAALSSFFLGLLDWNRDRLTPLALRSAADLVLLIPLVLWLR